MESMKGKRVRIQGLRVGANIVLEGTIKERDGDLYHLTNARIVNTLSGKDPEVQKELKSTGLYYDVENEDLGEVYYDAENHLMFIRTPEPIE